MILLLTIQLITQQPIYEVEGIVVTATRYPEKLQDIATATLVITKDEIEKIKPASLTEILQYAAGVEIKDYGTPGGVGSLCIRGISSNGTLVLLNGQPLNSMLFGMADLSMIDINSIKRIEIVKGPCSALYGANALGGVINIITDEFDYQKNSQLKITAFPNQQNYFLKFFVPAGNFGYYLEQTKSKAQGIRSNSDFSGYYLKNGLSYNKKRFKTNLDFSLNLRDHGVPGPMPYIDSITPPPVFGDSQSTSLYDRQRDRIALSNLDISFVPGSRINLDLKIYGNLYRIKYHTKYFWAAPVEEEYQWDVRTAGINFSTGYNLNQFKVISGFDFRYDSLNSITESSLFGKSVWDAAYHNIGYWIETRIEPIDFIKVHSSLRLDQNSGYGNFISPQLGIVYQLTERCFLKGSAGRAFRAPTFNDLYYPTGGNPDIKPEYGEAYELRAEISPRYNLFTSLAIFMRNINDKIAWLPDNNGLWKPQNVDYVNIKGIEARINTRVSWFLKVALEGTYLLAQQENRELVYSYYDWLADTSHIEFETKTRTAGFIPKYKFSTKLYFKFRHQWNLNIIGSYVGEQVNYYPNYEDYPRIKMDTKTLNPYYIVDITAGKKFLKVWELSVGVKNLFNKEYATQFGNSIKDRNYPMPGRRIFGQIYFVY